jgi:hypothetical protein
MPEGRFNIKLILLYTYIYSINSFSRNINTVKTTQFAVDQYK